MQWISIFLGVLIIQLTVADNIDDELVHTSPSIKNAVSGITNLAQSAEYVTDPAKVPDLLNRISKATRNLLEQLKTDLAKQILSPNEFHTAIEQFEAAILTFFDVSASYYRSISTKTPIKGVGYEYTNNISQAMAVFAQAFARVKNPNSNLSSQAVVSFIDNLHAIDDVLRTLWIMTVGINSMADNFVAQTQNRPYQKETYTRLKAAADHRSKLTKAQALIKSSITDIISLSMAAEKETNPKILPAVLKKMNTSATSLLTSLKQGLAEYIPTPNDFSTAIDKYQAAIDSFYKKSADNYKLIPSKTSSDGIDYAFSRNIGAALTLFIEAFDKVKLPNYDLSTPLVNDFVAYLQLIKDVLPQLWISTTAVNNLSDNITNQKQNLPFQAELFKKLKDDVNHRNELANAKLSIKNTVAEITSTLKTAHAATSAAMVLPLLIKLNASSTSVLQLLSSGLSKFILSPNIVNDAFDNFKSAITKFYAASIDYYHDVVAQPTKQTKRYDFSIAVDLAHNAFDRVLDKVEKPNPGVSSINVNNFLDYLSAVADLVHTLWVTSGEINSLADQLEFKEINQQYQRDTYNKLIVAV